MCVRLVESEVSPVEQTLGSLAMDAVTLLLTANNSNAGKLTVEPGCWLTYSHTVPDLPVCRNVSDAVMVYICLLNFIVC